MIACQQCTRTACAYIVRWQQGHMYTTSHKTVWLEDKKQGLESGLHRTLKNGTFTIILHLHLRLV